MSEVFSVLTAAVPEAPTNVVTTDQGLSGANVVLTWDAPFDNGSTILYYVIKFQDTNQAAYYTELKNCDGQVQSIIDSQTCTVPVSVLMGEPYNLLWG